jgi:hypothetical protein
MIPDRLMAGLKLQGKTWSAEAGLPPLRFSRSVESAKAAVGLPHSSRNATQTWFCMRKPYAVGSVEARCAWQRTGSRRVVRENWTGGFVQGLWYRLVRVGEKGRQPFFCVRIPNGPRGKCHKMKGIPRLTPEFSGVKLHNVQEVEVWYVTGS